MTAPIRPTLGDCLIAALRRTAGIPGPGDHYLADLYARYRQWDQNRTEQGNAKGGTR